MVDNRGERDGSLSEDADDLQREGCGILLEFGDLSVEANRVAYAERGTWPPLSTTMPSPARKSAST